MRWLVIALVAVGLLIQYRLWISPDGVREVIQLRDAVAVQKAENEQLTRRNQQLAAEVRDLKQGFSALEERARSDLGMIARKRNLLPGCSEGEACDVGRESQRPPARAQPRVDRCALARDAAAGGGQRFGGPYPAISPARRSHADRACARTLSRRRAL